MLNYQRVCEYQINFANADCGHSMHSSTGLPPQLRPAPMSSLRQLDVQRGPGSVPWCSAGSLINTKLGENMCLFQVIST